MRKLLFLLLTLGLLSFSVCAMDFQAPSPSGEAADLIDAPADTFAQGLWNICREAIARSDGALNEALGTCLSAATASLFSMALRDAAPGNARHSVEIAATVAAAGILLRPSSSMVHLGLETANELSAYGRLLLPVMTGALAAQGGATASAALYAGTAFFDSLLSNLLVKLLRPMLWLFLALSIANRVLSEQLLCSLSAFLRWAMNWVLKLTLYLFTGYMTVTGVVSGSADAAAVRAAKLTISGAVPVVGGILSDASEAVLVAANTLGSAAGIYGMLAVLAIFALPFLRIALHYLLLKGIGALCQGLDGGSVSGLMQDFSTAMGFLLAMVGTQTVLLMISTLCFMKGVG